MKGGRRSVAPVPPTQKQVNMPGIDRPDFKDRRDFMKSAGLAATGFAALPLVGCDT